jgi:uncharacterized repeat protein (TIGR04076 family)
MNVEVEVISQKGICTAGLKKGDKFMFEQNATPTNFCASAYVSFFPYLKTLSAGGSFTWAEKDGSLLIACPDAKTPIVFSLKAVEDK